MAAVGQFFYLSALDKSPAIQRIRKQSVRGTLPIRANHEACQDGRLCGLGGELAAVAAGRRNRFLCGEGGGRLRADLAAIVETGVKVLSLGNPSHLYMNTSGHKET
jgi:hypothetical protein